MTFEQDTAPGELPRERKRLRFDPTVNAGHILTFAAALIAGFFAYTDVKQVNAVQDERIVQNAQALAQQSAATKESLTELKQAVRDVARAVGDVKDEQLRRKQ